MTTRFSTVLLSSATAGALSMLTVFAAPTATPAVGAAPQATPAFTSVQPELLGVPHSYSNAWGDYDGDGDIDLLGGSTLQDKLTVVLRNDGGKKFTDVAADIGLTIPNRSARQTNWIDHDYDGDLDLSVISYDGPVGAQTPHNALFRNDGAAGFVNVLTRDHLLNAADHGAQFVDYDNDGAVDLSVTDGYGPEGGHFVFRNAMPEDAKRRSLSVLVLDAKGHYTRFGAEVRLFDQSGRIIATRQVVSGGGYNSQRAAPVDFGLAKIEPVRVEVTFMSKGGRKKQTVNGVNPTDFHGKSLVVRQAF